jgi:predicted lipid-binding transport protein (Tim44 family)
MEPHRFGRKLGIGVRVASRMAKERAAQASAASATQTPTPQASAAPPPQSRPVPPPAPKKNYAEPARRVGEGTRRFGKAFIGPLAHVSGTLWLEITGLFFALFAVFFGQNAWRARAGMLHGPEHVRFLVYAAVTLVFAYFCVSSFIKASRRGKRSAQ